MYTISPNVNIYICTGTGTLIHSLTESTHFYAGLAKKKKNILWLENNAHQNQKTMSTSITKTEQKKTILKTEFDVLDNRLCCRYCVFVCVFPFYFRFLFLFFFLIFLFMCQWNVLFVDANYVEFRSIEMLLSYWMEIGRQHYDGWNGKYPILSFVYVGICECNHKLLTE